MENLTEYNEKDKILAEVESDPRDRSHSIKEHHNVNMKSCNLQAASTCSPKCVWSSDWVDRINMSREGWWADFRFMMNRCLTFRTIIKITIL